MQVRQRKDRDRERERVDRQRQLERSFQHLQHRAQDLPHLDDSLDFTQNHPQSISMALQKQCTVVKALRKSLADEFGRLTSSSSDGDSVFSPKTTTTELPKAKGKFYIIFKKNIFLFHIFQATYRAHSSALHQRK